MKIGSWLFVGLLHGAWCMIVMTAKENIFFMIPHGWICRQMMSSSLACGLLAR